MERLDVVMPRFASRRSAFVVLTLSLFLLCTGEARGQACSVSIAAPPGPHCAWSTLPLSIANSTGTAPFAYAWSISNGGGQLINPAVAAPTLQLPGQGTVQVQLTITDANGCVAISNLLPVPISAPTGILQASLNNVPVVPDYDYGLALPTYDLCLAPPPGSTSFTFTGLSTGATVLQVDLGSGFLPAVLPMAGNFTPGLDTVRYIIQDPVSLCIDTLQVGVLVGTPNVTYTMSVAASQTPFRGCVGDSVEFTINTSQGFQPGTGYIIAYNDNGYVPVDTIFPNSDVFSFWRVFAATSCPYSVGAIQHTYDLQVRTIYGCTQDFASGNASSIFISEVPEAQLEPPSQTVCVGGGPLFLDNQSSGEWIQGNTCVPAPNFYYEVLTGTQGTDWTPNNNMGSTNGDPLDPPSWMNGSDPLSLSFLRTGQYTVRVYAGGSGSCPVDHDDVLVCVDTLRNVGFTSNTLSACGPVNISLSDTTNWTNACGTQTYSWSVTTTSLFCGGPAPVIQVPPVANPQFTITVPGVYQVTMQVNTPCGPRTQQQTITVYGPPTGSLGSIPANPCVGDVITLTSTAVGCGDPGFITQYVVAGNATLIGDQLTVTGAGPITVTLQGQNQCTVGWVDLDVEVINGQAIPALPTASITPSFVCHGTTVLVVVDVQPGVSTYSITWPGGGAVTGTTASFTATNGMNGGNVVITAGPPECSQQQSYPLVVQPISPIVIIASTLPVCEGQPVDLVASGAGTMYVWSELGGDQLGTGSTLSFPATETVTVVLSDVIAGCATSDTLLVPVDPLPVVTPPDNVVLCASGTPFVLPALPAGGDYSSTSTAFSEPDVLTPTPGTPDTIFVNLIIQDANGCVDSAAFQITVNDVSGAADAGPNVSVCWNEGPQTLIGTGAWQNVPTYFENGVFTPALAAPGPYVFEICATVCENLCDLVEVQVRDTVAVVMPPNASFCIGDAGEDFEAGPFPGEWSGSPYVDVNGFWNNPAAPAGSYSLGYTMVAPVTDCVTTGTMSINVNPPPTASIGTMAPCVGIPILLANESTGSTWQWIIDEAPGPTGFNPPYTFNSAGWHEVTVVATDGNNCTSTATAQVFVNTAPTIDVQWLVLDSCGEGLVQAVNIPFAGATYVWTQNGVPVITAPQPPPFVLPAPVLNDTLYTLAVTASNACDTLNETFQVTVRPLPVAAIGVVAPTVCLGDSITLTDQSYGGIDSVLVQWGDGTSTTSMDSVLHHVYPAPGDYTITYTAYGPCGSESSTNRLVTILPNQVDAEVGLTAELVCAGSAFFVENISVGDTAVVIVVNGESSTAFPGASFTIEEPGTYTIMLVAIGCGVDTAYRTITISPLPAISLPGSVTVCAGDPVQFSVDGVGVVGVSWMFGDGGTSFLTSPTHIYDVPDTYTATVTVQEPNSLCPSSDEMEVRVLAVPIASFDPDTTAFCVPFLLGLTNTAQAGVDYQWLVDGLVHSFAVQPPSTSITTPGPHEIMLIATYPNNPCADTTVITVFGSATPTASFLLASVDSCAAQVQLLGTNQSTPGTSATWYVDDEVASNGIDLEIVYTGTPGVHTVLLVVTAPGGCERTASATFTVAPRPVANFDWGPTACTGAPLAINNTSSGAVLWDWRWEPGGPSFVEEPGNIDFDSTGTYPVTLIVTGANQCTDTLMRMVEVGPSPEHGAVMFDRTGLECGWSRLSIDATPGSEVIWQVVDNPVGSPVEVDFGREACYPYACVTITLGGCVRDTCGQSNITGFLPCDGVYLPNTFTPNGDGNNDKYGAVCSGVQTTFCLTIFNRWGAEIFIITDPVQKWDGRVDGVEAPIGVYPVLLELTDRCTGLFVKRVEHVNLVR